MEGETPVIIDAGASYHFNDCRWPVEIVRSVRHVGQRYLFDDNLTDVLLTREPIFCLRRHSGSRLAWQGLERMRFSFRVRNTTNMLDAARSDPGYPDQVYLAVPPTFELSANANW
ncbi:hypothetical protein LQG66_25780 [Bradyrhizobium ontarionense]|uniref:Uncharacterized protein n=1 Tax=Bradyrhizobium ontarionense TaxID=2898149 RepID=A0ABY3R768_9BRAD|nr:hypothetical protein [Bradyrhizobium sp. A19]UFZ02666.1 hypothetical protein LQG66_25780 [Bradyrhizobium sp. A19]